MNQGYIFMSLVHQCLAQCSWLWNIWWRSKLTWCILCTQRSFISYLCFYSEKAMATHSSTLAWKIPWMEEPGGLQSMGSLRVGHVWVTSLSLFAFMHWRKKWQPTLVFLPGESQGWGSLVGCRLWGRTRLKWLSSSSSSSSMFLLFLKEKHIFNNWKNLLHH